MQQQTVPVGDAPNVVVRSIPGDLRVAGWDRNELMGKSDGSTLDLRTDSDPITISCDEDLILYLPRASNLRVDEVGRDVSLQALSGPVALGPVAGDLSINDVSSVTIASVTGDLSLRQIGGVTIESVKGDFSLRGSKGDCKVTSIYGDASVRDVEGAMVLEHIDGDLYVRNVRGALKAITASDAVLYLEPHAGTEYHVEAGDDLLLRLPPVADVELHLKAGSPDSLHVDFPGFESNEASAVFTVGNGAVKMYLTAKDDLVVTNSADRWDTAADFGVGMRDGFEWTIPEIPPIPNLPPDLSERINRRAWAALEREQSRTATKIDAAVRRAEAKARAAEKHARHKHADASIGRRMWDLSPRGPEEKGEPVSDEERLTILRMLQEKKISLEEAENLLAVLEEKE